VTAAKPRIATYTRVASRRDVAELARRQRRLAAASSDLRATLVIAEADAGPTPAFGRPGLSRLYDRARAGDFDVLLVEHLGRLSPDRGESERVADAFRVLGVRVQALGKDHRRLIAAGTAAAIVRLIGG
jgi:DNA invertase Pin-like site-specific DNA recombinase